MKARMRLLRAPQISKGSWLNDPRHFGSLAEVSMEEFHAGFHYASTQTRFIESAAGMDAEAVYYVWALVQRGIERHRHSAPAAVSDASDGRGKAVEA